MKYNELLNFEPITQVVKFSQTHIEDYQKTLSDKDVKEIMLSKGGKVT